MPSYSYIAKSFKGEPKTGILQAQNERDLARILRKEGYILISANQEGNIPTKRKISIILPFFRRVSLVDKVMFTRNLQVMIEAGISIPRALRILSVQAKSKKFKKVLLEIEQEIIRGRNFSDTLVKYPNIFSELFCNMIKVGEEAGTLSQVLDTLTQQMEKEHELKSRIKGAMVYPAVIFIAMIGIGILMLIVVVPKLAETFEELGIELPLTTRIVIAFGAFLSKFWYLFPFIVVFSLILLRMGIKTKTGKLIIDTIVLKLPIVTPIIKQVNSAYTVRTLSSLIASGVPIVRSLELVAASLGNIYYKRAILGTAEQVKKGARLAESLAKYENIYPVLVIQMIEVGEETGETAKILGKLAEFYEEEVANTTKNLSAIIEPVLMLCIGAAVGFFAISMIQPMYSMIGAL